MQVIKRDGSEEPLILEKIHRLSHYATKGLNASADALTAAVQKLLFNGIKTSDIFNAQIQAATNFLAREEDAVKNRDYTYVAGRLLLQRIYKEICGKGDRYPRLKDYISTAIAEGQLDIRLGNPFIFDLDRLNAAIAPERDLQFDHGGLQALYDRYFIRRKAKVGVISPVIEMPQHFYMRVAMGVALNYHEKNKTEAAIQFYHVMSSHDFSPSTPTLFNAGTPHSQLSSCYLNTVHDSIDGIFETITECANLSKWAGGQGTDWTRVRESGHVIAGTNGKSSGPVPYLKVYNDTAVAVNQGGKRNGAFCAYMEPWHPDFQQGFAELLKESGDERLRTHDINTAGWIPDLLLKRYKEDGVWSLFSPASYPELHELYGEAFEKRYEELEREGKFRAQVKARDFMKHYVSMLFETGGPWITFKDECNRRNPQQHVGVVHSSNLCTEITLNTSDDETAVCNLGSINWRNHIVNGEIDLAKLRQTVRVAIRMLDNVIDINFYPSDKARNSNLRHRPIGFGMMGWQEALVMCGIDFESQEHMIWADRATELWSFFAIEASSDLAAERGAYLSYEGSSWSKGILPIDTARVLPFLPTHKTLDWDWLRAKILKQGMRNSNVMAIAPTATISNIIGTSPCTEPIFEPLTAKSNMSGTFFVPNPCFKYDRPDLVKTVWEIDMEWVIKAAAVRQKWIDQAQSTNLWKRTEVKGSQLMNWYLLANELGLKTTYYLRVQSTNAGKKMAKAGYTETQALVCSLDNPSECEACQ